MSAAGVGFPFAAQAARLSTHVEHPNGEVTDSTILLITSREQARMGAASLLALRREYWGVEAKLHSPLDVSALEDKSRVRLRNNVMVLAVFRRLAVSIAYTWMTQHKGKRNANLPGFFDAMNAKDKDAVFNTLTLPPIAARSALGLVE